jgi:hypothetical protein
MILLTLMMRNLHLKLQSLMPKLPRKMRAPTMPMTDDSDDEPAPKKAAKPAPAEPMDEEEPAMSVVVNLDRVVEKGTQVGPRRGERKKHGKKMWGE